MSLAYRMMYRLGVTPWEHTEPPLPLAGLIEGPDALPPGDMLDIGCGTGRDAVYCAHHGWTVTAVDAVPRALDSARRNARQAQADVRFLHADITSVGSNDLGSGYSLLVDVGCLHGARACRRHDHCRSRARRHPADVRVRPRPPRPHAQRHRPGPDTRAVPAVATRPKPPRHRDHPQRPATQCQTHVVSARKTLNRTIAIWHVR